MEGVVAPVPYDEVTKYLSTEVFGWLSPTGDLYIVDFFQHAEFIKEFYKNDKRVQKKIAKENYPITVAYSLGWIRLAILGYIKAINVTGTSNGLSNQHDNIKRLEDLTDFKLINTLV
jgi:hypothetical protein